MALRTHPRLVVCTTLSGEPVHGGDTVSARAHIASFSSFVISPVWQTTHASLKEALLQGAIFSFLIVTVPLYAANLAVFMAFQVFETEGIRKAIVTCL